MNNSWMQPSTEFSADDLRRPQPGGVALTRIVNLAPDWAELGLQGALPQLPQLQLSSRVVVDDRDGPCRRLRGTLASRRGWFRIPVELELTGWSTSATELTLRPRRGGRRPGWARWYLSVGTALMDRLLDGTSDAGQKLAAPASTGKVTPVMKRPASEQR